jgi:hypothetical protein
VDSEFNVIVYFFYGVVQVLGCLRRENFRYGGNVGNWPSWAMLIDKLTMAEYLCNAELAI